MLLSISFILLVGMSMSWNLQKIRLAGLLGMLITGIVLGPYALNLLDQSILGHFSGFKKNCPDYYFDKGRAWAGSVRTEENRKIRSDDVLCPCKL